MSCDVVSVLLALGHQLAFLRPQLFRIERLEVIVNLKIGQIHAGGRATEIRNEDFRISPSHQTSLRAELEVEMVRGELAGIEVRRMTVEQCIREPSTLQHLALFIPARILLGEQYNAQLLIGALDERRYRVENTLPDWLVRISEEYLLANVRFMLASHPDAGLLELLRQVQGNRLRGVRLKDQAKEVKKDLNYLR